MMAQPTTPDALGQSHCTIGFFTLPRELRDNIYDVVWQEKSEKFGDVNLRTHAARPKSRLISRQFKSEYDERSPTNSTLHISDPREQFDNDATVPRLAIQSTHLILYWSVPSCVCATASNNTGCCSLNCTKAFLKSYSARLGGLPKVRTTDMRLHVDPSHCLRRILDEAIKFPMLIKLKIVSYDMMLFGAAVFFAIWSKEKGLMLDRTEKRSTMKTLDETWRKMLEKNRADAARAKALCVEAAATTQ